MRVLMNQDQLELYQSSKSRRYREVERNRELMKGFIRVVNIMTVVNNVHELSGFSYLHYEQLKEVKLIDIDKTHYGNKH